MSKLTFLGTGTSSGVPLLGCNCEVCLSGNPKNNRLRTSAYLITDEGTKILIDAGPDFRLQALKNDILRIDGILITHSHQDHIGGLDDLRLINVIMKRKIEVYGTSLSLKEIKKRFDYIFKHTQEGGGKPQINLNPIKADFYIKEQKIVPIPILHGRIPILGYRINNLTYITDASFIDDKSIGLISGTKILVINALRPEPHPTHFSLGQALEIVSKIRPEKTYFIHLTHHFLYERDSKKLPENTYFAYDGLVIEC